MRSYFDYFMIRRSFALLFLLAAVSFFSAEYLIAADDVKSVLRGKVTGADGKAVEGAMIFVYDSADVKRAANFISARTDKEGMYRMVVPAGSYWLVARSKNTETYGPLTMKDRHSGDARETELVSDREIEIDFVVADLMEAIKMKSEERERPVKITGRIIDEKGSPVSGTYAIANRNKEISRVPSYLSAWVDHDGRFTMYVPKGRYFIGSAASFPPAQNYSLDQEADIYADTLMDIIRKTPESLSK